MSYKHHPTLSITPTPEPPWDPAGNWPNVELAVARAKGRNYYASDAPKTDPAIGNEKDRIAVGELLRANCTTGNSRPASAITWKLNGDLVSISLYPSFPLYLSPQPNALRFLAAATWPYCLIKAARETPPAQCHPLTEPRSLPFSFQPPSTRLRAMNVRAWQGGSRCARRHRAFLVAGIIWGRNFRGSLGLRCGWLRGGLKADAPRLVLTFCISGSAAVFAWCRVRVKLLERKGLMLERCPIVFAKSVDRVNRGANVVIN